ncbi:MAG: peptidase S1, partial [Firmicutes bacterium HGW-Firmicutes-13]
YFFTDILAFREEKQHLEFTWPEVEERDNLEITQDYQEYQNTAVVRAAQQAAPSVVGITNMAMIYDFFKGYSSLQERASGSGVIIDSNGFIVTNYHVIQDASELMVTLETGEELSAEVVGADSGTDLAVIKINKTGLPAARFGDSDGLQVGELAVAIGNPLGLAFKQSVTVGVISALDRSIKIGEQTFSFIQTDAAINDGNSGGPLINAVGEVIGINTAKIKISGVEGMGFAIPSNTVKKIVQDLIEYGKIIRPWMGVIVSELDENIVRRYNLSVNYGILVDDVVPGGPAAEAGIGPGDVIVEIAGQKINSFNRLREVIHQYEIKDTVKVKVVRGEGEIEVAVTFEEMPKQGS